MVIASESHSATDMPVVSLSQMKHLIPINFNIENIERRIGTMWLWKKLEVVTILRIYYLQEMLSGDIQELPCGFFFFFLTTT